MIHDFFPQFFERKWWKVRVGTPRRGHCCNWELGTPVGFWESSYRRHAWIILRYSVNVRAGVSLSLCLSPAKHTHTHIFLWPCLGSHRGGLKWVSNVHIIYYWVSSHCTNPLQMLAPSVLVCMCAFVCVRWAVCAWFTNAMQRTRDTFEKEVGTLVIGTSLCVFVSGDEALSDLRRNEGWSLCGSLFVFECRRLRGP